MDAGDGIGGASPATEDETIARRRSRRVSFAETTAVHVFERDEDSESPPQWLPDSSPSLEGRAAAAAEPEAEAVETEGEETEGEDEFLRPPVRFVREIDSSSPGSAAGSVASNDDNFFGPVSTSFILSGRPSDSGMSDDNNHDITLDSTAFSLHFHNVAPPDDRSASSAGSLRTPYSSTQTGHLTESAGFKNIFACNKDSGVKFSSDQDGMSHMSLVADTHTRYDYGKPSPTLNNLLQEVNMGRESNSPTNGPRAVAPDHASTVIAVDGQHREGKSCIENGVSTNEQVTSGSPVQHISTRNPVSPSSGPIQEDDVYALMEVDIHEKPQVTSGSPVRHISTSNPVSPSSDPIQEDNAYALIEVDIHEKPLENCNINYIAVHSDGITSLDTPAVLSPSRSPMCNVDLQTNPLDQFLSKDQPPEANNYATASPHSSIAVPAFAIMDAELLNQNNEVLDRETALHTPKTTVQPLQIRQGSVSSLRSKRQRLFGSVALSNSKLARGESHSLENEFVKHGRRISALKDRMSKFRLPESPAAHNIRLALVERNQLEVQPKNISFKPEDHSSTISIPWNSPPRQQLKETGQASFPSAPPRQELNEVIEVQDSSNTHKLDMQPNHGCNSLQDLDGGRSKRGVEQNDHVGQERLAKSAKMQRSPIPSLKQLHNVSSSPRVEGNCNEAHNGGQSVKNIDQNKVVSNISDAIKQVFSTSISKLNIQQLDLLEDMLGKFQMARKYKRLSTAMRIQDCWSDLQKRRLDEARSLHDKLLYARAKLQINRLKLDKLQNKAQLCQVGIQECCYLKSKISRLRYPTAGVVQMKNGHHAVTPMTANDRQDGLVVVMEKKHELTMLEQKVENLRTSLEFFCKTKGDISCDEVIRIAREQLEMRIQCRVIHQLSWLWEFNDLVKRENKRDVILNYCNLLFQRITLNISDMSGIIVNNSLNGTGIGEAFPNMNAYVAFNSVFKAEENQRAINLKCLQKKTMETSLLLGNLVDVLEEIRIAKMELLNLISAAFDVVSRTLGRLAFQLCFMNFKSGKRIVLTIDMTYLNCAVYLSEPSELQIMICGSQTTIAQTVVDELMVSTRNLQPGCMAILRLCRMISQLVHASSG